MKLSREEWLNRRRSYMCASDAAAALGMSPWVSPADLARDKWGEKVDEPPNETLERGQILEPLVLRLYERAECHKIIPGTFITSQEHDWMAATPDAVDTDANHLVQAKTSIMWCHHKWIEVVDNIEVPTIPPFYRIQGQHDMAVTGALVNQFAVLFADASTFRHLCWSVAKDIDLDEIAEHVEQLQQMEDAPCRFCVFPLERDDSVIAQLVEQERTFWEKHVVAHVLPADKYTPETETTIVEADDDQRGWMEKARVHHGAKKEHETEYDECKGVLTAAIGEATGIHADGIGTITYKAPRNVNPKTDHEAVLEAVKSFVPADRLEEALAENTSIPKKSRVFLPKWEGAKRKGKR